MIAIEEYCEQVACQKLQIKPEDLRDTSKRNRDLTLCRHIIYDLLIKAKLSWRTIQSRYKTKAGSIAYGKKQLSNFYDKATESQYTRERNIYEEIQREVDQYSRLHV